MRFETTAWSIISAARGTDSMVARDALESLCRKYWPPLYSYVRRQGFTREEAEDAIQEFFARLLDRDFLHNLSPDQGRFRSFLLACLKNFLSDEWDRRTALKRGGGQSILPLDVAAGELQYARLTDSGLDPFLAFDRQWAESLLDAVVHQLEAQYAGAGKQRVFEVLRGFLGRTDATPAYGEAARALGMNEGAVRTAVHRMRVQFAALTRAEIAQTVQNESEIQEELDYLIRALGT